MRIYVDDNTNDRRLLSALRAADHEVVVPLDVDRVGASDPKHLTSATQRDSVVLTRDHEDFTDLHELVLAVGGRHPGILIIRSEKRRKARMTHPKIVSAIAKLEASGLPLVNHLHL